MTAIWQVGGHWYVGSPTHNATALEVTIGDANEFTIGDYNFFCLGFYLDATVGPLVEFIMPFPYSIFGGTLVEIIIPQAALLAATVAGLAAGAAVGVGTAAMGESTGVQAGAAVAAAAVTAAYFSRITAKGCQVDLVYGNYFFTVYGDCTETVEDKHHHHTGPAHFHFCAELLHSVAGPKNTFAASVLVLATTGITVSALGPLQSDSLTLALAGSTALTVGAMADLNLSAANWTLAGGSTTALAAAGATINLGMGTISLNAATIYLYNTVEFSMMPPVVVPIVPVDPIAILAAALATMTAAATAAAAAAGHAAAGHP